MLNQRPELGKAILNILGKNSDAINRIIEAGIRKKEFKKVDVPLTVACLMGTISNVISSKKIYHLLIKDNQPDDYIPYEDEHFKKRIVTHLKQLMQSHLARV